MDKGDSNRRGNNVKVITQKTSADMLMKAIEKDKPMMLSPSVEAEMIFMEKVRGVVIKFNGSFDKVVAKLQKEPFSLTYQNAYLATIKAINHFNSISRELTREAQIKILFENIAESRGVAKACDDSKGMAQCDRNHLESIEKFMGENKAIDQNLLRLPDVIAGFHPEWYKNIAPMDSKEFLLMQRAFATKHNRKRKIELLGEEIDFEDVLND